MNVLNVIKPLKDDAVCLAIKPLEEEFFMKIVINQCHGGFGLSYEGLEYYYTLKGIQEFFYYGQAWDKNSKKFEEEYKKVDKNDKSLFLRIFSKDFGDDITEIPEEDLEEYCLNDFEMERIDAYLIKTVEDLGGKANGEFSDLKIIEIPDDVKWEIEEYDGVEWVAEVHRTWM